MASIYDFALSEATSSTTGGVNTAEGQDPSTVNDANRVWKQITAGFLDDIGGNVTVGGTADAITITIAEGWPALATGMLLGFKNTVGPNTTAATIAVTNNAAAALGTKEIRKGNDEALVGGEMVDNGFYLFRYDTALDASSGGWAILNPVALGDVTLTGTQTLTNKTLTTPTLTLKQGTGPTPTAEGDIQWDTDDDAIVVGDGAAQKIFRPNAWEFIASASPNSDATVTFTGLSAYRRLRLTGFLRPETDAVSLFGRTSTNNGSSYDAGAGGYSWQYVRGVGATAAASSGTATAFSLYLTSVGNATAEGVQFEAVFDQFNQATSCWCRCDVFQLDNGGNSAAGTISGLRLDSSARDALQVLFSSGDIATGHLTLDGIRG
jgi:hypothetical protein